MNKTLRLCPYYIKKGKCNQGSCDKLHYTVTDPNIIDSLEFDGTLKYVKNNPESDLLTICLKYFKKGYCNKENCIKLHLVRQDLQYFEITDEEILEWRKLDKNHKRECNFVSIDKYVKLKIKYKKLKERVKDLENRLNN